MTKLVRIGRGSLITKITVAETKSGSTAIIGPVRLSYMSVFKTRKNEKRDNVMEYSVVGLIEKTDAELLKFVRERIQHALIKKFHKVLPKYDTCLMDGDVEVDSEKGLPMYPGFMFISTRAEADQPPLLYQPGSNAVIGIEHATQWVSGDWGNLKLDFFGYNNKNTGVSTRLKAVQFTSKDVAFGKGAQDPDEVASEFGDVNGVDEALETEGAGAEKGGGNFLD